MSREERAEAGLLARPQFDWVGPRAVGRCQCPEREGSLASLPDLQLQEEMGGGW